MKKVLILVALAAVAAASQAVIVYDNLEAPSVAAGGTSDVLWGTSSAIFGDQVGLTAGGTLDSFKHTLFNSTTGGNTGNVLTAVVNYKFYNLGAGTYAGGVLSAPLIGQFNGNINFGTGLNAGFYSVVSFTGLTGLNINLPGNNIMITQQITSYTGTSVRLGTVMFGTDNIGTSVGTANSIYRKNATTEGLLTFTAPAGKLGYQVGVVPEPASMAVLGLGAAALLRRRKKA